MTFRRVFPITSSPDNGVASGGLLSRDLLAEQRAQMEAGV
jgi:hypothetical protein